MPPLTPEEIQAAIDAALNGTGAPVAPKAPAGPTGAAAPPAGSKVQGNGAIDPNGYTWHQGANGWEQGYMASAAAQKEAGIGPSSRAVAGGTGGGTTTNYAAQNAAQKDAQQQQSGSGKALPQGFYMVDSTRATNGRTVATLDPVTHNWVNAGYAPNRNDLAIARTNAAAEMRGGTTTPGTPPPLGNPLTGAGMAGMPGTVQGNQAPLLPSFAGFTTPGLGISSEGMKAMRTGNEMNTLLTSNARPNGPQIPGFGVSGLKPTASGNNYNFTPQATVAANAQFPGTTFMVPQGYQAGPSGFSIAGAPGADGRPGGGAFQAFDMPFGVTGPSLTGPGGAGVATLQGPQNVTMSNADKSVGYGLLVNSPMAYNNIGLTYGRDLGGYGKDAATGAIESLMLADAQRTYGPAGAMALLTAPDRGSFTGQPGFYGNTDMPGNGVRTDDGAWIFGGGGDSGGGYGVDGGTRFAGGGRIVTRPLGVPVTGPKTMVTNGPKGLFPIGPNGQPIGPAEAIMGEDNRDPGYAPNRERLTLSGPFNSRLDVKPLEPFATGGTIKTYSSEEFEPTGYVPPVVTPEPTPAPVPNNDGTGYGGNSGAPPAPVNDPIVTSYEQPKAAPPPVAEPTPFEMPPPPVGYTPPVTTVGAPPVTPNTPGEIPIDPGGIGVNNFNAFDPNILAPWERAQRELTVRDAARDKYGYRNTFAGLKGPTGIQVLAGDVPTDELPPGMYYDPSGQVTRAIGNIIGAQENYRALGPEEDVTPVMDRVSQIGLNLDDQQKVRDLTLQRTGVQASSNAGSNEAAQQAAQAAGEAQQAYALMQSTQAQLQAATIIAGGNTRDPNVVALQNALAAANGAYQSANNRTIAFTNQANTASNTSFDQRLAAIDAQLAEIQGRIPAGFSEAEARTELARLQQRVNLQDKRVLLKGEVQQLAKIGVPKLNGPIIPVRAAA